MAGRGQTMAPAGITIYGRTYLDAQVEVDLETLGTGKGKVDATVLAGFGGFACNAARAIGNLLPAGAVRVVTAASPLDVPRLRAALPKGVRLDAIPAPGGREAFAPVSIIINPTSGCRILRDPMDRDRGVWRPASVAPAAWRARLHMMGRLPVAFASAVLRRARAHGAWFGWVGGDALPPTLEARCDLLCVNAREAGLLLGVTGRTAREMAEALAARARRAGAVRVVTGAGRAPAAAAFREGGRVRIEEARPREVSGSKRLLGVGDVFAVRFLVAACFDAGGRPRSELDVPGALAAAQRAAEEYLVS